MRFQELVKQVESVEFSAQLDVISSFQIFLKALEKSEVLALLIEDMEQKPAHQQKVFHKLENLLNTSLESEYQNPHDAAIAGYLYALIEVDNNLGYEAAQLVKNTPRLWWAKKFTDHILDTMQPANVEITLGHPSQKPEK